MFRDHKVQDPCTMHPINTHCGVQVVTEYADFQTIPETGKHANDDVFF